MDKCLPDISAGICYQNSSSPLPDDDCRFFPVPLGMHSVAAHCIKYSLISLDNPYYFITLPTMGSVEEDKLSLADFQFSEKGEVVAWQFWLFTRPSIIYSSRKGEF